MSRKVVEIPVEVWEFSLQDAEQIVALYRETLRLMNENARLKAEVEAQAKRWAESEDLISHYKQQMDEAINDCQCARLKAEVERLRYVGDGMAVMVGHIEVTGDAHRMMLELSKEWNAAKEGKSV